MVTAFTNMVVTHKDTAQQVMKHQSGYFHIDETGNWVTIYDEDMNIIDGYNRILFRATYTTTW